MPATPTPTPQKVADATETFALLGISESQGHREVKSGRLKSLKIGRRRLFRLTDIDQYLADRVAETMGV